MLKSRSVISEIRLPAADYGKYTNSNSSLDNNKDKLAICQGRPKARTSWNLEELRGRKIMLTATTKVGIHAIMIMNMLQPISALVSSRIMRTHWALLVSCSKRVCRQVQIL